MTQMVNRDSAGGSDPLADAQMALQSATAAAAAFHHFAVLIESFAEKLTVQQDSTLKQVADSMTTALEKIAASRNDALRDIYAAQRSTALYRPALHNKESSA
ncbi:MAG: hypothetical protein SF162_13380 [bacterium]|nr:hypothetical protein [bacterium]